MVNQDGLVTVSLQPETIIHLKPHRQMVCVGETRVLDLSPYLDIDPNSFDDMQALRTKYWCNKPPVVYSLNEDEAVLLSKYDKTRDSWLIPINQYLPTKSKYLNAKSPVIDDGHIWCFEEAMDVLSLPWKQRTSANVYPVRKYAPRMPILFKDRRVISVPEELHKYPYQGITTLYLRMDHKTNLWRVTTSDGVKVKLRGDVPIIDDVTRDKLMESILPFLVPPLNNIPKSFSDIEIIV